MSACEVNLNTIECLHPYAAEEGEYPPCRTRCYACGQPACGTCSKVRRYCGGRRRICNDCAGRYQQDDPPRQRLTLIPAPPLIPALPHPPRSPAMLFMNEYEIDDRVRFAQQYSDMLPNLRNAIYTLARLADWANANSDGWHSWPKPARSAKALMTLIQSVDRFEPEDVSEADLKKALSPVKSFLTRQGVNHAGIL